METSNINEMWTFVGALFLIATGIITPVVWINSHLRKITEKISEMESRVVSVEQKHKNHGESINDLKGAVGDIGRDVLELKIQIPTNHTEVITAIQLLSLNVKLDQANLIIKEGEYEKDNI